MIRRLMSIRFGKYAECLMNNSQVCVPFGGWGVGGNGGGAENYFAA